MIAPDDSALRASIKRHEGAVTRDWRHVAYDDADGRPIDVDAGCRGRATIGIGRLLSRGLSDDEVDFLLGNDIAGAYAHAAQLPWFEALCDERQRVVVEMVFNLGIGRFRGFRRMSAALGRGNYAAAADEMLDSRWARQVGVRAERLARRMREG